jgi:MYXO-CTERM domain-containing protein
MLTLLLLLLAPAQGQGLEIHYQGFAGGVSVDASGITTDDDFNLFYEGPSLEVLIPGGAVVEKVFAVVHAENDGWHEDPAPGNLVEINGWGLGTDSRIAEAWRYNLHDITETVHNVGSGPNSYQEKGHAERRTPVDMDPDPIVEDIHGPKTGHGVAGTTLFVIYNHPTLAGRRHITIATDSITYATGPHTVTGLPSAGGTMLFAPTIVMECADEQSNTIEVGGVIITEEAGGRDDGAPGWGCIDEGLIETPHSWYENWHSLITSGSFGFSGDDVWVATDKDCLTTTVDDCTSGEPDVGDTENGRLSDELYEVSYAGGGSIDVEMYGNNSSAMRAFAMVIEMDTDGDGLVDSVDDDADNDGIDNPDDVDPYDPYACEDADTGGPDGCDDCTIGVDQFGELADNTPENDGPDTDGDGVCNVGDPDDDGDGVLDEDDSDDEDRNECSGDTCDDCVDYSSDDPTGETVDPDDDGPDTDDDGLCDAGDPCTDPDGDGYGSPGFNLSGCTDTTADNCPNVANANQTDTDGDGQGDACDLDDDDDTLLDTEEDVIGTDPLDQENTDGDQDIDALDLDTDGDGVSDADEAGDTDLATVPVDTDSDLDPDFRDTDSDNDGILDGTDNCRVVVNPEQEDLDQDGIGDACDDESEIYQRYFSGGGCRKCNVSGGPSTAGWWLALLFLVLVRRREKAG